MQHKSILAMIFNEIKCHVNTTLGLVGRDASLASPPVSTPVRSEGCGPWVSVDRNSVPRTWDCGYHKLKSNAGQYKSGAAKRKLRVEQERWDEHIKKKIPCLLTYGFETSLISNTKHKKPSLGEAGLRSSCKNEMAPASELPGFVSIAPDPELCSFVTWLRLQLRSCDFV